MSLMTRRGLSMMATLVILVGACSGTTTPTQAPTSTPNATATSSATGTPTATTPPASSGTPVPSMSSEPSQTAGCHPLDTTGETEPALEGSTYVADPPAGDATKTLVLAEWQDIDTLNPYYAQANTDIEAATPALLGMVDTAFDLKYVPEISTNVPLVSNGGVQVCDEPSGGQGMQIEYNILAGLNWSDGQPITCADLEATWKWVMDPDQSGLAGGTVGYENITAVTDAGNGKCLVHLGQFRDPNTQELRAPLAGETSFYAGYIGLFSPLLPKHYIETIPVASATTDLYPLADVGSGVYSGPYIPTSYTSGAQLEYAPNPQFFAAHGTSANFAGVIFKYYPNNPDGEVQGYTQGEFDLGMDLNHTNLPSFYVDPNDPSKGFQTQYSNVFTENALEYELWPLNNASISSKFGGVNLDAIKSAIAMIAPKTDVAARANGGTIDPLTENNFVSPLSWFYKQEPAVDPAPGDAAITAAQALLCGADATGAPACDPNSPDHAGPFSMGKDGYLHLDLNDAVLSLNACTTARPGRADALGILADQAKKVGIQINTDPPYGVVPSNPNFFGGWGAVPDDTPCNLIHGNYDIAEHAYVVPADPTGSYNVYTCQGIPENNVGHNGQNETRTCSASFDAAWQTVISSIDPAKITTAMAAVQDFYSSNVVEIPLFFWKNVYLVNPKLHNVVGNPTTASVVWNIEDMWLEP